MKKNYLLQPLESLLHEIAKQPILERKEEQTANLIQTIMNEKVKIYNYLKAEIFNLKNEEKTRIMVRKSHHAIILLINETFKLQKTTNDPDIGTSEILEYLLISLEEIQQFLEISYPDFLSQDKRLGLPELEALKLEISEKLPLLPAILEEGKNSEEAIHIVMDSFVNFIQRVDFQEAITIKEADYHKLLLNDLISRGKEPGVLPDCPTLHELLLYWNFNSAESITYFTNGLETLISECQTPESKLEFMHLQFKRLLHIPVAPKKIYDKNFPSMKSFFCDWLQHEIDYLNQKIAGVSPLVETTGKLKENVTRMKVLIDLSADQIGLIIRAADEARILIAKSLSIVFETIVPNISTPNKENPSWKNMRARTYNPERREVALSVDALEKMIAIIKKY